jgi:hypothetical protein
MTPLCAILGARRLAILLASVIFVFPAIYASAELYEWVDEKGQRNFTDNPNSVPEKYRPKATVSPGLQATPETLRRDAERRRREAAEAAESSRQRERAKAEKKFDEAASECANFSRVEIIPLPGAKAEIFGSARGQFEFDQCMAASGHPTKRTR